MSYDLCNGNSSWPSPPCPDMKDGRHLIQWAASRPYPSTCTYTTVETMSVVMGMLSILFWMMVTMPQLWVNYKTKQAEGLSIFFLLQWFGGDITNLAGCFLTKQTASQTFLAMYYVMQDICLTSQFIYYTRIYKREDGNDESSTVAASPSKQTTLGDLRRGINNNDDDPATPSVKQVFTRSGSYVLASSKSPPGVVLKGALVILLCSTGGLITAGLNQNPASEGQFTPSRRLLQQHDSDTDSSPSMSAEQYYIGIAIGWLSAALYLCSRVPQLVKNWKRGSTDGLSPVMFTMAVCANVTYFLGMILLDSSADAVQCHLPWIVGSLGTVQFDVLALFQFLYYNMKNKQGCKGELEEDTDPNKEGKISDIFIPEPEEEKTPMILHHEARGHPIRTGYYGRLGVF